MVEDYAYLFLGDDEELKKNKVDSIKSHYLDNGLRAIDFEVVYSDNKELSPPKFNEALSYASSNPLKKRIVFLKRLNSLSKDNRNILMKYLKNPSKSLLLLLDAADISPDDPFIKELSPFVKKISYGQKRKLDTFDLTRAIVAGNLTSSLRILNVLLSNRENPQHILGGLIWQWENMRDKLKLDKFRQGFSLLLNTDLRIKTGKLTEKLALEMLVIRLSYLI